MQQVVRMAIGANRHTASTVRTDFGPVGIAALRVDLPAQSPIGISLPSTKREGISRANIRTFMAVLAENDHVRLPGGWVGDQG